MRLLQLIRQDWRANARNPKARIVLTMFRLAHAIVSQRNRALWALGIPYLISYRVMIEWVLGIEIPPRTKIGPGCVLFHGQGLVVNDHTVFGSGCVLRHNTTIGCVMLPDGTQGPSPIIGNDVELGSNVVILGGITIGDNAAIGAGSVVVKNVPANAVVVGNPGRVIRIKNSQPQDQPAFAGQ